MSSVSILLADNQYLIRRGLRQVLDQQPDFRILAEVTNERELENHLSNSQADVIIIDYNQPSSFTKQSLKMVREKSPQSNILIISADNDKQNIYDVLAEGVNSFLTKQCDEDEIIIAVRATAKGEKFFCNKVLDLILERSFPQKTDSCIPTPLSPREIEITRYIAEGKIAKEIAHDLNLSTHTIYTHRKNILKKLNISSSSQLVLYAITHGIVENPKEAS
ncbi:MAG: response regulator transcription factor [Bacteroidota bacterium]